MRNVDTASDDMSRLCVVCGTWIKDSEDIVGLSGAGGPAHLECAWKSRDDSEVDNTGYYVLQWVSYNEQEGNQ